jgi:hypothetical protein
MSYNLLALEYQRYLTLREEAHGDWQRLARISQQVADQFKGDLPYGGDIEALRLAFTSATNKTREAMAQYRAWLAQQQGGLR